MKATHKTSIGTHVVELRPHVFGFPSGFVTSEGSLGARLVSVEPLEGEVPEEIAVTQRMLDRADQIHKVHQRSGLDRRRSNPS